MLVCIKYSYWLYNGHPTRLAHFKHFCFSLSNMGFRFLDFWDQFISYFSFSIILHVKFCIPNGLVFFQFFFYQFFYYLCIFVLLWLVIDTLMRQPHLGHLNPSNAFCFKVLLTWMLFWLSVFINRRHETITMLIYEILELRSSVSLTSEPSRTLSSMPSFENKVGKLFSLFRGLTISILFACYKRTCIL